MSALFEVLETLLKKAKGVYHDPAMPVESRLWRFVIALLALAAMGAFFTGVLWGVGWLFAAAWNYGVPAVWAAAPVLVPWKAAALLFVGNTLGGFVRPRPKAQ